MPSVRILPENLANLIAAGEVVERPASVVKELVENALDAGARRVEVRLEEGGKRLIQVTDDGAGMSAEDLVLAVQRFATTKIASADDLQAIATLGFRGEALPSIGAVARLRMVTRQASAEVGHVLTMEAGEITALEEVGCAPGTVVTVADLFHNTPARRKFLATTATERGHCADWVVRLALAHPEVSFRLLHGEGQVLATSGSGEAREVLAAALGSDTAREMLPVELEAGSVRLSGYLSGPRLLRATRAYQFLFVNRRYVRSRPLSAALTNAYGMLLPAGKQPVCALYLELDPQEVDPNVHPTKIEVRFKRPGEIFALAQQALTQALAGAGYRSLDQPRYPRTAASPPPSPALGGSLLPAGRVAPPSSEQLGSIRRLRVNPFSEESELRDAGVAVHEDPGVGGELPPERPASGVTPRLEGEVAPLGQLWGRYLVAHTAGELLLVDQHRAAERVLYERLLQAGAAPPSQLLALPQTLELTGAECAALAQSQELLEALGFRLEEFGGNSFLVRAVPASAAYREPLALLRDLAADLAESGLPAEAERARQELAARVACHAALKAGQRLTAPEAADLLRDLLASSAPAVCPHGDPILVSFPVSQIDRRFGR